MNKFQADICLLAVTLCWSCEVILHAIIPEGVNPFATVCMTSLIGAGVLCAYFARKIRDAYRRDGMLLMKRVLFLSALSITYNVLFLVGLEYFDVPTGAFTASMTVVILPVILLIVRRNVDAHAVISAVCVLSGVILAVSPSFDSESIGGHAIMTLGCLARALFIVKLNDYAREHDPVAIAAGISGISGIVSFFPWLAIQPGTFLVLPWSTELIAAYFIYGYFIVAFAGVLNIYAQRRANAIHATIIYSTEIIFTIIWAFLLPNNIVDAVEFTPHLVIGCALVVLGNVWETLPVKRLRIAFHDKHSDTADAMTAARPHPFAALLKRLRTPLARKMLLFGALVFVYLIIALPFKVLTLIPGFADIRPVEMLMPAYGIFFGIPGAFAFAVGNLIADILSNSLRWTSIAGFVANFAFPYALYLMTVKLRSKPFHLRDRRATAEFYGLIILCAALKTVILSPSVAFMYPELDIFLFASSVFLNAAIFPIALATPFIILIQDELGFVPLLPKQRKKLGIDE